MAEVRPDPTAEYLARVAAALRLHDDRAREIVDELAAHIADATDALVDEGLDPRRAEREALARLGDPAELGRGIGRANRTTRRLLAGASGGVWAATRAGILGLLIAYGAMLLLVLGSLVTVSLLNRVLATDLSLQTFDRGWNTVFLGAVLWFAVNRAAMAGVGVASQRSLWRVADVRPVVAVIGAVVMTLGVGWLWPMAHNWASVLVVGSLPLAAVVGALRSTGAPPKRLRGSWSAAAAIATFVLVPAILFTVISAPAEVSVEVIDSPTYASLEEMERAQGYDRIAALLPEAWRDTAEPFAETTVDASETAPGYATLTARRVTDLPDSTWRDARLEVWRVAEGTWGEPMITDAAPLAVVPAERVVGRFTGTVRIDRFPGVVFAGLALTAVGPDGTRYLIAPPRPQQTAFEGTIADWFAALTR